MNTTFETLKEREGKVLCNTYGRYPLAVARAEGARLFDLEGRRYVDLLAGIAVANVGHSHPALTKVIAEQAEKLIHVSNLFYQEEQVVLAEKLLDTCHSDRVFFCNSGAEANEAAVKLARRYMQTVRKNDAYEVITLEGSFHGRTLGMIAATGQDKLKEGFAPIPEGFVTVPWNDLDALAAAISPKTAAVMVEMVQGEGGIRPMSEEYAQGLAALCKDKSVLLIVDEIQTGLCRTGSFWAFQRYGIEPDIFTSAKGLANGLPMGAMLATEEAAKGFTPGAHATTFGGGGVLAAVAAAVVDILQEEKLAERAAELGAYAMGLFTALQGEFPDVITEIREAGLMLGIELAFPAMDVWKQLLDKGFVLNVTQERVLRLVPPLTMPKSDLDDFAQALRETLAAL